MKRGTLMEGQIRRGGVWADDLMRPIVARVFFELPDGTYHPGMFVASLHDALRLVLEYGLTVPRAFVTLHDEVILDVKEGVVDFPDDVQPLFDEAKARFPSWNIRWLEPGNLGNWTRSQCAKLVGAAQAYAKASGFDGSAPEAYDHRVNRLEHELQSVAAQYGFDLYRFGYQVPGVVCAELECFDADHSQSGNGISSMDQAGRSTEKQRSGAVATDGAQAEFQFEPQSTPVDESLRNDRADGDLGRVDIRFQP
ncbi:hypothetical protein NTCA1_55950 [Novosphingobium sp. TCA1]|nr:hypothetical protein NTCA1_55950 [Novosphingobium sp. TCA1]